MLLIVGIILGMTIAFAASAIYLNIFLKEVDTNEL